MLNAIGSFSPVSAAPGPSAAALNALLERYQKQLSDCVNCKSANTPESRATAQALSDKIAATRSLIEKTATPGSAASQHSQTATDLSTQSAVTATLGNNLNVFA